MARQLPEVASVLAVVAHPDDESFGLGATLDHFQSRGAASSVLCLTKGEASTLGLSREDLGVLREHELFAAASELGVGNVRLRDYSDGGLAAVPLENLVAEVESMARLVGAELLLVFDDSGVTGHHDHQAATRAAVAAGRAMRLPVLAWTIESDVALALNRELSSSFVGRPPWQVDIGICVDRARQLRAIALHTSQSTGNAVLWRRLELQGTREVFCWLHDGGGRSPEQVKGP